MLRAIGAVQGAGGINFAIEVVNPTDAPRLLSDSDLLTKTTVIGPGSERKVDMETALQEGNANSCASFGGNLLLPGEKMVRFYTLESVPLPNGITALELELDIKMTDFACRTTPARERLLCLLPIEQAGSGVPKVGPASCSPIK